MIGTSLPKNMKNFFKILLPSVLFLLTLFIVGTFLSKPFWGEHDWNGARYGNIAKNYLRYGYATTRLGQVENGGVSSPKDFIYYTHYQPLLPILISLSYRISEVSEAATRTVPLIATAGLVVVIYFIGKEIVGWRLGLFSSLFALATPMLRYYGKNPVHEPLALFFASIAFLGTILIKKKKPRGLGLMLIGFILTALTNWSFAFLLLGITVFLFEKDKIKMLFPLWILGVVLAGLQFVHIWILTGSPLGGGIGGAFLERTSADQVLAKFGIIDYFLRIRLWSSTLFTNSLLVSAFLGLLVLLRSKDNLIKRLVVSLAVYSIYPVFFANASFVHSYFIYYFVLPLSLLGGFFAVKLIEFKKVFYLLAILILFGIWFERGSYVKALNDSRGDKKTVEISQTIKTVTSAGDSVQVEPFDYVFSRMPILSFYSDRNIILQGTPGWTVTVSGDEYKITKVTKK